MTVVEDLVSHLDGVDAAATDLLDRVQMVVASRHAEPDVLDAAISDLAECATSLADLEGRRDDLVRGLGRELGLPTDAPRLSDLEKFLPADVATHVAIRRASLRRKLCRVHDETATLSLELARLRADTDEVIRQSTGSPGTYDARGRTTFGTRRRQHGVA